jgi:hypothetical protein
MKTTRKRVEDAMKENREECRHMRGNGRIGERGGRNWEEERRMEKNPKTRWRMHREETDGQTRRRRKGMDHIGSRGETVIDYEERYFEEEKGRKRTEKERGGR